MSVAAPLSPEPHLDGIDTATIARVAPLATAPLLDIARRLREAIGDLVVHRALVIFTEDCTGRPQKKAGDPAITERVTIPELAALRQQLLDGRSVTEAQIGGALRPVRTRLSSIGSLLVLCEPQPFDARLTAFLDAAWELTAQRIRAQVADASPTYLRESRAASAERLRVTTELTERHATDLTAVLAALRSGDLDDRRARTVAITLATDALVNAKTANDVVAALAEEPVSRAFERLRHDLSPLTHYGRLRVEFVEPPADGRALPGEVAHAARAIVRSAVLAMNGQEQIGRIRVQWGCDGTNLLIALRDDGPGRLDPRELAFRELDARVVALGGRTTFDIVPDWGTEIEVCIPLDAPQTAPGQDAVEWQLGDRELEVLRLLIEGRRNREIAQELGISENTVKFHTRHLYRKLGVTSRAAAITKGLAAGAGRSASTTRP